MQDVEFTVENNKISGCYKQDLERELQNTAVRIAVDMVKKN